MHEMATKAMYNAIAFENSYEGGAAFDRIEAWQKRNWRAVQLEALFHELHQLGIDIDRAQFLAWADESDSPEALLELLLLDEQEAAGSELQKIDHIYLILFELWRRLLPERRTLSIVADEIDHLIREYDTEASFDERRLGFIAQFTSCLFEFIRILQATQDLLEGAAEPGVSSQAIFANAAPFFMHDIARRIFDIVLEEVDVDTYADFGPIVDGIMPFIIPSEWGLCMKAHVAWYEDEESAAKLARKSIKAMASKQNGQIEDLPGLLGILLFAARSGDKGLFHSSMKSLLDSKRPMSSEEVFELISLTALYAETVDHPMLSQVMALLEEVESSQEELALDPMLRAFLTKIMQGG